MKYKRLLFIPVLFAIFTISFATKIFAADAENTRPPVIESFSGPTSGYVGQGYQFSTTVSSTAEYPLIGVCLTQGEPSFSCVNAGDSDDCTETSCTVTGTYTPSSAGTYGIYTYVAYRLDGNGVACDSIVDNGRIFCQGGTDKYRNLVVAEAPSTPVVKSLTGPVSGYVGGTYQFAAYLDSIDNYPILTGIIYSTPNLEEDDQDRSDIVRTQAASGTGCTSLSCTLIGSFTPTVAGIYNIHVAVSYTDVDESTDLYCRTHPATSVLCSYSADRYMNFVVTEGIVDGITDTENLPATGIMDNQMVKIYVGAIFMILGILTTQIYRIGDALKVLNNNRERKRKSKFENKFQ